MFDLRMAQLFHVFFVAVDAAAGFGEFDNADGFVVGRGLGGRRLRIASDQVGMESFAAESQDGCDWKKQLASNADENMA